MKLNRLAISLLVLSFIAILVKSMGRHHFDFMRDYTADAPISFERFDSWSGRYLVPEIDNGSILYLEKSNIQDSVFRTSDSDSLFCLPVQKFECIDNDTCYFIHKMALFCQAKRTTSELDSSILHFSSIKLGDNMLCYGTDTLTLTTGIFRLNGNSMECVCPFAREKEVSQAKKNSLVYAGRFTKGDNYVTFRCEKQSVIYVLTKAGNLVGKINTKEMLPFPEVAILSDGTMFYKRGKNKSSYVGAFEHQDCVYVLSLHCKEDNIVLDSYLINGEYLESVKLPGLKMNNKKVKSLLYSDNRIYLFFDRELRTYKFT